MLANCLTVCYYVLLCVRRIYPPAAIHFDGVARVCPARRSPRAAGAAREGGAHAAPPARAGQARGRARAPGEGGSGWCACAGGDGAAAALVRVAGRGVPFAWRGDRRAKGGERVDAAHLTLTSGATSGCALVSSLFFTPGSNVFIEDPSYFLAVSMFKDYGM